MVSGVGLDLDLEDHWHWPGRPLALNLASALYMLSLNPSLKMHI